MSLIWKEERLIFLGLIAMRYDDEASILLSSAAYWLPYCKPRYHLILIFADVRDIGTEL